MNDLVYINSKITPMHEETLVTDGDKISIAYMEVYGYFVIVILIALRIGCGYQIYRENVND